MSAWLLYTYSAQAIKVYLHSAEDGFLKTFFEKAQNMTPEERAEYLEKDDVRINTIKLKVIVPQAWFLR